MSDQADVTLAMTGNLTYSSEITLAQAVQVLALLTSQPTEPGVGAPTNGATGAASPPPRQDAMSPKQALEAAGAKTNPEKIVAFAALVSRQSGRDTFGVDDVKPLFKQARETAPGNLTRDLSAAIQSGWVAVAEESGEYYLTGKVIDVLDKGFEGLSSARQSSSRSRASTSRRPRKAAPVPAAFTEAEVSPVVDGIINYHKVKTKTDKYLWAVNAARLLGIESVTPTEMAWLTDRLGEGIPNGNLNTYFRHNMKSGHVNKNAQGKVRITPSGIKHIEDLTMEKSS